MSVLPPVGEAGAPPAPMAVPPGGVSVPPAVVLPDVPPGAVDGDGALLELVEEGRVSVDEVADSSFLPQALSDRAAIRARAAHCAIGDWIIGHSLQFRFDTRRVQADSVAAACGPL
jgi:hypothetical protein